MTSKRRHRGAHFVRSFLFEGAVAKGEFRHLQSSNKGRVGAKRKVSGELYEKFEEINRKHRGDKTYRELAVLLKRHTGIKDGYVTLARAAKREG